MDKIFAAIPEYAASKAEERELEKHPVAQPELKQDEPDEKEVEEAVDEINPDDDSLDWRG